MSNSKITIDEIVTAVTSSVERRLRDIYAKHGDVYFEMENGTVQYPDEASGYMRTALTGQMTITISPPKGHLPDSDS